MYEQIIAFWFSELRPKQWWAKDPALDLLISNRFQPLHQKARAGELFKWRETAQGSLAEIIILDQFSRNMYRGMPESFACDPLALALAQTAISKGLDKELSQTKRGFLYLPFMHSESKIIHQEAVKLFKSLNNMGQLDFEYKHKQIIDRFGRYPHRNDILNRNSTSEEIEFLKQANSGF